ncbi:MAG: hypothetical protein PHC61_10985 [Chitinivibrionales bacterium]|nr:hypothetical protein [Chitinivibrionales bacterium]
MTYAIPKKEPIAKSIPCIGNAKIGFKDKPPEKRSFLFIVLTRNPICNVPIPTDFTFELLKTGDQQSVPRANIFKLSVLGNSVSVRKPISPPIGKVIPKEVLESYFCEKAANAPNKRKRHTFLISFFPF